MLSASLLLIARVLAIQADTGTADTGTADISTNHFYYASRLIGALLIATAVPLLIDRRARRSSRIRPQMYIGHVGAALAAKRVRTSIGLFVLLVATYAPDWVDGGLCLAGVYNPVAMLSHSIPAVLLFALVGFTLYALKTHDSTASLVIAAVILSHVLLDWITGYKPTWPGGPMIGLGLYEHPIADFIAEGLVIAVGAVLYGRTLPPRRRPWIDVSIMLGALLALQLGIDIARMMLKSLPKC